MAAAIGTDGVSGTDTVGVLGCGRMGAAIVRRLTAQGVPVLLWNRTRATADALAAEVGVGVVETPRELRGCPIVLSVLHDGGAAAATFGDPEDGLLAGLAPGCVVVEMATMTPDEVRALAAATERTGAALIEAPVSGRPFEIAEGTATLLVGGDAVVLEKARSALDMLGTIVHVGPLGSGAVMKLGVNAIVFASIAGIGEALALAGAAGITAERAYDAIEASAVGSTFVRARRATFVDADAPAQAPIDGAHRVVGAIVGAGERLGVALPVSAAIRAAMAAALARGHGSADVTHLARVLG